MYNLGVIAESYQIQQNLVLFDHRGSILLCWQGNISCADATIFLFPKELGHRRGSLVLPAKNFMTESAEKGRWHSGERKNLFSMWKLRRTQVEG